jgi:hypothetical protein
MGHANRYNRGSHGHKQNAPQANMHNAGTCLEFTHETQQAAASFANSAVCARKVSGAVTCRKPSRFAAHPRACG